MKYEHWTDAKLWKTYIFPSELKIDSTDWDLLQKECHSWYHLFYARQIGNQHRFHRWNMFSFICTFWMFGNQSHLLNLAPLICLFWISTDVTYFFPNQIHHRKWYFFLEFIYLRDFSQLEQRIWTIFEYFH